MNIPETRILIAMKEQEIKAWRSLAGYKFWMFGYHCGQWVSLNKFLSNKQTNPFRVLVQIAKNQVKRKEGDKSWQINW